MREVQKHNSARSCWVVFDGDVYDVTSYIAQHPGGSRILLQNAGKDITCVG
ncbi:cytochrome b5 [Fistulina hepatica ATCC 64428]|uniref:Cytochrome b5 n=1 Tax=Fistulina hepatica ATCC 64428 TaxID=1128425 RepID=A0A0D7AIB9_9AGAR|nr:cytochrome b5 [Fistulina hepatica ATCC 64428]